MRVIATEVRRRSELAGFHPAAFARKVGISESHLCRILKGEKNASPGVIKRMAEVAGCDVLDIASVEAERAAS